jgi:hypothetical protein
MGQAGMEKCISTFTGFAKEHCLLEKYHKIYAESSAALSPAQEKTMESLDQHESKE